MELRHFRCFAAVARHLHFTRAAEDLGISTPAMSKAIREMEQALKVRLFQRTKRSVALTAAGELFQAEVHKAMGAFDLALETARRGGRGEVGRIELGYVSSAAFSGLLQREIRQFREQQPNVRIEPHEVSMKRLPLMLEEGSLDICFLRPPMNYPPGVAALTLLKETYVVAVPETSHWARQRSIRPVELAGEDFVVPEQLEGTLVVARRGRFSARVAAEPGGLVAVMSSVSIGQGISIVPQSVVDHVHMPGVTYRPLAGKPVITEIAVAYRRHEQSPAVRAFIEQIGRSARPEAAVAVRAG